MASRYAAYGRAAISLDGPPQLGPVFRLGRQVPFKNAKKRFSACQRQGLAYEKRAGKEVMKWADQLGAQEIWQAEWLEYDDGKYAQPDMVVCMCGGAALLFEFKLTWVPTDAQLNFYCDLLRAMGFNTITRATVCKNLRGDMPKDRLVHSLDDLYDGCILQMRR